MLTDLFTYHFMVNALLAGTLVAITASLIGWFMVVRRQTFAGHTLSVIAFPGAAAAALAGAPAFVGYFGACVLGALVLSRASASATRRRWRSAAGSCSSASTTAC
jgi:zinc/manganese transport system permease protein